MNLNSTKAMKKFFESEIAPIKVQSTPHKQADSFYLERKNTQLQKHEMELNIKCAEDISRALIAQMDDKQFKDLMKKFMKMRPLFKNTKNREDVSPFVYEMF